MKAQIFVDLSPLPGAPADEEWRIIPGWPEYAASSYGRVRSFDRLNTNVNGITRRLRGQIIRPRPCSIWGHLSVTLTHHNQRADKLVHHLVLFAFVGARPDGMECRHIDGNPRNNHVSNLAWSTHLENEADKVRHGTLKRGPDHFNAKLSHEDTAAIKAAALRGETHKAIASMFGVSRMTVSRAIKGSGSHS